MMKTISQRFFTLTAMCFSPVEDGDSLDPCILSTLRKLQDGYFAGARSVSDSMSVPFTTLLRSCSLPVLIDPTVNDSTGCRRQTSPASRPLRSTRASASWMKRMMKTCLKMMRRMTTSVMKSIAPSSLQVAKQRRKK